MKKKPTMLFILFIFIQSIVSAGFFGSSCDKSKKGSITCSSQSRQEQSAAAGDESGFHSGTLQFFLFSF